MERQSFLKNIGLGTISVSALAAFTRDTDLPISTENKTPFGVPIFIGAQQFRSWTALGGIGAGSIKMRAYDNFHNRSMFNNYPNGAGNSFVLPNLPGLADKYSFLFFVVKNQEKDKSVRFKLMPMNNAVNEAGVAGIANIILGWYSFHLKPSQVMLIPARVQDVS